MRRAQAVRENGIRRLALLTTIALLAMALPASAKMPPFEMEVEPRGNTAHVEVTISRDESLVDSFDSPELNGLLAVFPSDEVDEEGRPLYVLEGRTDVPLSRVEPGTYQGSVPLEPGHWAVVSFPDVTSVIRRGVEGWYPRTVLVEVTDERSALWALAAVAAAIATAWGFRAVAGRRPV